MKFFNLFSSRRKVDNEYTEDLSQNLVDHVKKAIDIIGRADGDYGR